jgi:hypothetical protein
MFREKNAGIVVMSLLFMVVFVMSNFAFSQDTAEDEETDAPDTMTWTQLPEDHQEIELAAS